VIWRSWSPTDYASALWGDGIPTVTIARVPAGRGAGPARTSHQTVPTRGLHLRVDDRAGIIDQPYSSWFLFDPRDFTRRGRLVRARLGDATWTMRWWRLSTLAVERDGHRITRDYWRRDGDLAIDAGPLDTAVALALSTSVSHAARTLW
jgi:hypothetical protein